MDRTHQEYARVRQQELERETRSRLWANELRGERRRDGSLRIIWLSRR
jgi:hypothetical protein